MKPPIDHEDVFGYPILVAEDFDGVLARTGEAHQLAEIGTLAQQRGLMLLQARGGAGKTITAARIAALEPESHGVAIVSALRLLAEHIDLSIGLDIDLLMALSDDQERAALLRNGARGLVVIDGINEISRERADEILLAIPALAARYPFIRYLVTDRLNRRDIDQDQWILLTLGPVPEEEARSRLHNVTGPIPDHLTIPYYLDHSIRQGGSESQVDILRDLITVYGGVPSSKLDALAAAVYAQYRVCGDRMVGSQTLVEAVGRNVVDHMVSSGLLVAQNEEVQFAHHLTQDFLAALHLSADNKLWSPAGFDAVTLRASSFDALALAAGLIAADCVDDFVHRVFDWNYSGAAYLLEEDQAGEKRIQTPMRAAILAMLAEKRFDRMVVTARKVEDALHLQDESLARGLLAATDRHEIVDVVSAVLPENWEALWPQWFGDWYKTFQRPSDTEATTEDVENIKSTAATVGWATSNMLKRLKTSEDLCREVRDLATEHADATVRWRAVHALGAWPTQNVVDLLLARVGDADEDLWVRFGALRSVLEVAASGSKSIRRRVFAGLGRPELARQIAAQKHLRKEAIRALEVAEMPDDWHARAGDFMEYLWTQSDNPLDRDEVVLLAHRMRSARPVDA
jgi:hypothetical protein